MTQQGERNTTTIIEKRSGGGMTVVALLAVIVIAVAAYFLVVNDTRQTEAVSGAAQTVSQTVQDTGEAVRTATGTGK